PTATAVPAVDPAQLPDDPALLKAMLAEVFAALRASQQEGERTRQRLDQLLRRLYGPRSERLNPDQLLLFPEPPTDEAVTPPPPPTHATPHTAPAPSPAAELNAPATTVLIPVRPMVSTFITASRPASPIARGLAGPGLLAHVIVSKFCDHLPLYRCERMLARFGVTLSRSTLCDWLAQSAALLRPLWEL